MLWGFLAQVGWTVSCVLRAGGIWKVEEEVAALGKRKRQRQKGTGLVGTCHNNAA